MSDGEPACPVADPPSPPPSRKRSLGGELRCAAAASESDNQRPAPALDQQPSAPASEGGDASAAAPTTADASKQLLLEAGAEPFATPPAGASLESTGGAIVEYADGGDPGILLLSRGEAPEHPHNKPHALTCVHEVLPSDDKLAFRLVCRAFRDASRECTDETVTRTRSLHSSLARLQWGIACGAALTPQLCSRAAELGELEQLEYLRTFGCPWDKSTCALAACEGHLAVLQWARANGCPWDETTCSGAAYNGHMHVLEWAHAKKCPWTPKTIRAAVSRNDLAMVRWALHEGCSFDEGCTAEAAARNHLGMLQFLRRDACRWNEKTVEAAAFAGSMDTLAWAVTNGAPLGSVCTSAAQGGQLPALQWVRQWLVANITPAGEPVSDWGPRVVAVALEHGHHALADWAIAHGCPQG
jgi:hypothetical protein